MKATGVIRRVDRLGRIVLPKELRNLFKIVDDVDSMEIFVEDDKIILKKYQPSCIFCGETNNIRIYKGQNVCEECYTDIGRHVY